MQVFWVQKTPVLLGLPSVWPAEEDTVYRQSELDGSAVYDETSHRVADLRHHRDELGEAGSVGGVEGPALPHDGVQLLRTICRFLQPLALPFHPPQDLDGRELMKAWFTFESRRITTANRVGMHIP